MNQLMKDIKEELDRLKKQHWYMTIEKLTNHFDSYPFEIEEQNPAFVIRQILIGLNIDDDMVEDRFIYKLQKLDCFTYRAQCVLDEEKIFWNPLQESFKNFLKRNGEKLTMYQAEQEYPASDIIRTWLYQNISKKIYHGRIL